MDTRDAFSVLMGRWDDFYQWLGTRPNFDNEVLAGAVRGGLRTNPDFCPVHGGASGEAWHFYDDAHLNGGCVCNSCGSFGNGFKFLAELFPQTQVLGWVREYMEQRNLQLPPGKAPLRLYQWGTSLDPYIAANYLQNRGLPITSANLPESVRGSRRFHVYGPNGEDYGVRPVMLTLIHGESGAPLTYQMVVLDARHRKAKDIPQDHIKRTAGIANKGALSGSYAELGAKHSHILVVGEGVETVLAVVCALREVGVSPMARATLGGGASAILEQHVPEEVTTVLIASDFDMFDVFFARTEKNGGRIFEGEHKVYVAAPESKGNPKRDWLDAWVDDGLDTVLDGFSAAIFLREGVTRSLPSKYLIDRQNIIDLRSAPARVLYERFDASILKNPPRHWYLCEGSPVVANALGVKRLRIAHAEAVLDDRFSFYGEDFQILPRSFLSKWWSRPKFQAELVSSLPVLQGVVFKPSLLSSVDRKSGWLRLNLIHTSGYDAATGILGAIAESEEKLWRSIGETTRTEAWLITQGLMNYAFRGLDFKTPIDRANALAALFAPILATASLRTPFFLLNAPDAFAAQHTLLRRVTSIWSSYRELTYGQDDRDLERGFAQACKDNCTSIGIEALEGNVGQGFLDRLIRDPQTALAFRKIVFPLGGVVYGVNNKSNFSNSQKRNIVAVRLSSGTMSACLGGVTDTPSEAEVAYHRQRVRKGFYRILQAWLKDGAPLLECPHRRVGFEQWSDLMYSLMRYLGAPDAEYFLMPTSKLKKPGNE